MTHGDTRIRGLPETKPAHAIPRALTGAQIEAGASLNLTASEKPQKLYY